MSNQECIIDTNLIINLTQYLGVMEKINEIIETRKIKLVVCDQVYYELSTDKLSKNKNRNWSGLNKSEAKEYLSTLFGDSFQEYPQKNTIELKAEAKRLEEKYKSKNLHHGDSKLLAILKLESWDKIITNDKSLINCCKDEKIEIVHNPEPYPDLKYYRRDLKDAVESGISEEGLRLRMHMLYFVWWSVNNNPEYNMNEKEFIKFFNVAIFELGKQEPRFAELRKRVDNEPNLASMFLEKISFDYSFKNIMSTLDDVLGVLNKNSITTGKKVTL